jgi:PAS domain S-box-containing protein
MTESKQIRILYMEDDPGLARLVRKKLERVGYVVDVARDGEEGLAMYAVGSYDVVAMDQAMPVHDGLDVIRILASQAPLPPTIVVTGAGDEKTAVEAMKLGARDYIVKDVDGGYLELLPSVIERVLYQQRLVEENQRAEEERERRSRELVMLNEIGRAVTSSLDLKEVLALLLDRARQALDAEACSVALLDDNGDLVFHHAEGEGAEAVIGLCLKSGQGIAGRVAQSGQSALVPDAHADPCFYGEVAPGFTTRDMVCVPLVVRDEVIGVIELLNKRQGTFGEDDVRVLESVATQAATAIENARLYEEAKGHADKLAALYEIGKDIASTLELDALLQRVTERSARLTGADKSLILLVDTEAEKLTKAVGFGLIPVHIEGITYQEVQDGISGWVLRERTPTISEDILTDPRNTGLALEIAKEEREKSKSIAVAPLFSKGEVIGTLTVINNVGKPVFSQGDLDLVVMLASQAAIAIENARLFGDVEQAKVEWEATFDAIGDGISIHDRDFRPVRANRALTERLGTTPEALVGHTCYELFHHHTAPSDWCPHLKAMKTGQPQTVEIEEPVLDGNFLISAYPLFDERGQVSGSVHVLKDITERKQLEAQLLQAQKMESIGQLAGGIAHDFNNLLTPISGFAELLLGKAPEGSQQQEHLRRIKVAAERAAALTGQLLLFTRQARGQRRSAQLNSVVEETCNLLKRSIPKEIAIELRLEPELWAVEADSSQMSQVLVNLCVNARDAMSDGGTLTLETRNVTLDEEWARAMLEARPGPYVRLSVSDTGCGMSAGVQARLFEPFFTTKEVGEGTGLGLSVVYGIVKGHNGFINVYSEEGRGSTFHVYLPAIESAVEEREVGELVWPTGTETILLVDDEEMVRALGQAVLEPCGYTVLMAEDGVQALEVYQAHRGEILLVVLDVIMPQMNGRECLRRLRELDPQVKVLISTGYTARGLAQELVAEGALGVVEKPFQVRDFATAVQVVLDKS